MITLRYRKTAAGRDEIRARSGRLTRSARNLLLIIDESRTAQEWLGLVAGVEDADFRQLLLDGLIESLPRAGEVRPDPRARPLPEALEAVGYDRLYPWLNSQVRERLGLVRGYQMVIEIERCPDVVALRAVALKFFKLVEEQQGAEVARRMRSQLMGPIEGTRAPGSPELP